MNRLFTTVLPLGLILAFPAWGGNSSSGGGSTLVAGFVSLANGLLKNYPGFSAEHRRALTLGLNSATTVSTPVLVDPQTHRAIANQKPLVAWGSPGLIQLKEDSGDPSAQSWERLIKENKPVAHHIAHELFRASGILGSDGKSIDEGYQLSIGVYHLDSFVLLPLSDVNPAKLSGAGSLIGQFGPLKPNGHLIYCMSGGSDATELLFAETEKDFVLSIREAAFEGQVLGPLLTGIDPGFGGTGHYLQLTAHLPPNTYPLAPVCHFTFVSPAIVDCGLGALLEAPTLTDGVREEKVDAQLYFSTEQRVTQRARQALLQELVAMITLYGDKHPFTQGGFHSTDGFDPRGCVSR